ncbi:ArsB/NhaD family transporter [Aquisalibacillus elongatus]|uniref:Putative tyrosine transporter P-protein n=1 Tax=Aquisalibacillus elongatus TaxID=485577 RepID=A0A3N5BJT7_9BACI|nr:ArsB/NhaD family transporter [Aquisalibacillus elongatus]RPF55520.1 putative tyrosine transporter P-protein [Aquisalibacillus elongatus]
MEATIVITIFVISYVFLLMDKINRALIAATGAALMVLFGIFSWDEALSSYVDWSTIALLFSMMVMITITQRTGIFEFIALWMIKKVSGRPVSLFFWIGILTAIGSALLDNVTTVLLLVPVLLHMIRQLNLKAFPYLVNVIISSNIGGTATMIGDPPNIMIGQAVPYLDFLDFIVHLAPIVIVIHAVTMMLLYMIFKRSLSKDNRMDQQLIESLNPADSLKKTPLLYQSITILTLTIVAFTLHGFLHIELTTIAIMSALLMLLISENDESSEVVFQKVEWTTLFFFVGLFVLVGGLEKAGIIDHIAYTFIDWTEGDSLTSSLVILWSAGILSGFVDNIPYVASMIPVIEEFQSFGVNPIDPLWWSLALGACLGGNGSLLGASANVVVAGIASTQGEKIPFIKFMFYGLIIVLISLAISSVYVVGRYFL